MLENSRPAAQRYLVGIDGVRCIAVLAVIVNHLSSSLLNSGYLGVDVFFVVSGFVITKSLLNYKKRSVTQNLLTFYSRRFKRLMPALIVFVIATGISACLFNPEPRTSIFTGVFALFGLSNIYLVNISSDYFGSSSMLNFFTHTWSLGVEEQFYFLYPLIFLHFCSYHQQSKANTWLLWTLVSIFLTSLATFILFSPVKPDLVFYSLPFRAWELAMGGIICLLLRLYDLKRIIDTIPDSRLLILLLVLTFFSPPDYQVASTILSVLLTGLIILTIHRDNSNCSILKNSQIGLIGRMSYSLYLWHWSVVVTARWTIGVSAETIPFLLLTMFLLAYMSYRFVESPWRHHKWLEKKSTTIGLTASVLTTSAAFLFFVLHKNSAALYQGTLRHLDSASLNSSMKEFNLSSEAGQAIDARIQDIRSTCHMTPHLHTGADIDDKPIVDATFISNCIGGDRPKVILIGDSFSNSISLHTALAAEQQKLDFRMIYGFACPYPLDKSNIAHASSRHCDVSAALLQNEFMKNLNPGDIIVLRLYLQSAMYIREADAAIASAAYDSEINRLGQLANENGAGLIVVGSNWQKDNLAVCANPSWFNRLQCSNETHEYVDMTHLARNRLAIAINNHMETTLNEQNGNVSFINLLELYCNDSQDLCPLRDSEITYLKDDTHLSPAAVDLLFDTLNDELNSVRRYLSEIASKPW